MPLNPPSYRGQDVWYSPNVYVNKVPVALWQPPQVGDSLVFNFTLQPDASQPKSAGSVTQFYDDMINDVRQDPNMSDVQITAGPPQYVGETTNVWPTGAPPSNATPDNLAGTVNVVQSPLQLPPGYGPLQTLDANLNAALKEAQSGQWNNINRNDKNVQQCFIDLGRGPDFSNAWCAAFANAMLKRSGIAYVEGSLFAMDFQKWGSSVPINDPKQWRKWDIVVFNRHVAFLEGIPGGVKVSVLGGNQGGPKSPTRDQGALTVATWRSLNSVLYVARAWEIPPEWDKPLF